MKNTLRNLLITKLTTKDNAEPNIIETLTINR